MLRRYVQISSFIFADVTGFYRLNSAIIRFKNKGGSSRSFLGAMSWRRGPNLPPFSSFSTDLGHFILKSLKFAFLFYFVKFLSLFSRFFLGGGGKQATLGLGGMAPYPLDPPMFTGKLHNPLKR